MDHDGTWPTSLVNRPADNTPESCPIDSLGIRQLADFLEYHLEPSWFPLAGRAVPLIGMKCDRAIAGAAAMITQTKKCG